MSTFIYFLCLAGIAPAALFAIYVGMVQAIVDQKTLGNLAAAAWNAFLNFGEHPSRILLPLLVLPASTVVLILTGCFSRSRPFGFSGLALIALGSFAYIIQKQAGPKGFSEWILFLPPLAAGFTSVVFAVRHFAGRC